MGRDARLRSPCRARPADPVLVAEDRSAEGVRDRSQPLVGGPVRAGSAPHRSWRDSGGHQRSQQVQETAGHPGLHAHDLDRRSGEGASSRLAARQCPVGGPTDAGRSHAAASGGTSLGHGAPDNGGHERIPAVRTIPPVELGKRSGPAASDEVGVPSHGRGHRFETCHAHCLGRSKVHFRPGRCGPCYRPATQRSQIAWSSASISSWKASRRFAGLVDRLATARARERRAPAAPLIPLARRWSMACSRW